VRPTGVRSARTWSAGIRAAALVALLAASVAACVSTGGTDQKVPGGTATAASGGHAADGPRTRQGLPGLGHGGGRDGMAPSPTVSGTPLDDGSASPATPVTPTSGKPGDRAVPPPGGGATSPHPTGQPSPTGDRPTDTPTTDEPTTTSATPDPPSSGTTTPGDGTSGPGAS